MARPTMDNVRTLPNKTQLFRWKLYFSKFPTAVGGFNSDDLDLRCESTTLPKKTSEIVETVIRGHTVRENGRMTVEGTLTLNFIEAVDYLASQFIDQWQKACWEFKTGKSKNKEEIEAELKLHLLDNQDEPVWEYDIVGVIFQDEDPGGSPDGATSDPLKPVLTLAYDDFDKRKI